MSDLRLDRCSVCNGRWFDRDELTAWAARAAPRSSLRLETFSRTTRTGELRRCPRCEEDSLATHDLGWAVGSHCPGCRGVFLDAAAIAHASSLRALPSRRVHRRTPAGDDSTGGVIGGTLLELVLNVFL